MWIYGTQDSFRVPGLIRSVLLAAVLVQFCLKLLLCYIVDLPSCAVIRILTRECNVSLHTFVIAKNTCGRCFLIRKNADISFLLIFTIDAIFV